MPGRYFKNTFLNSSLDRVQCQGNAVIQNLCKAYTEELLAVHRSSAECDGGIYVGLGGVSYGLMYCSSIYPENEKRLLAVAEKLLSYHLEHAKNPKEDGLFLLGQGGVLVTSALLSHRLGDQKSCQQSVDRYAKAAHLLLSTSYMPKGADEVLVGRAGYLFGVLNLRQKLKMDVLPDEKLVAIMRVMIESGRVYARKRGIQQQCPLMYVYHGTEYLGEAHGLAGILHAFISFPTLLPIVDGQAENDVKASVDWLMSLQTTTGNFPCAVDEIGRDRGENDLVHWCHGAPGVVHLMARAFLVWKEEKYLQCARRCCDLIWERGLLKKGPGICHGVAGSGYAFLLLYQMTGEEEYYKKAIVFAEFLGSDEFMRGARTPDSPFSLFEGKAGTVCFLTDLQSANVKTSAEFPLFPVIF